MQITATNIVATPPSRHPERRHEVPESKDLVSRGQSTKVEQTNIFATLSRQFTTLNCVNSVDTIQVN